MPCTAEKAAVCAASCAAPLLGYTHLRLHQDWARPPPRLRRDWAHPAHICKPQPRSRRTTASMPAHASAIASRRTRTGAARGSATRGSGWARDLKLFVRTGCGDDLPATVALQPSRGGSVRRRVAPHGMAEGTATLAQRRETKRPADLSCTAEAAGYTRAQYDTAADGSYGPAGFS